MDRPLWQSVLPLFLIGLAVQRAAVGFVLRSADVEPGWVAFYSLQTVVALVTALGLWLGRRWTVGALLSLGAVLAGSAIFEAFFLRLRPPATAIRDILVVGLATGALAWALRREFGASSRGKKDSL